MVTIAATALRSALSETLSRVTYQGERVLLERHGKPVAGLVSAEDLQLLEALEDRIDIKAAKAAMKETGKPIPWRTLKKTLGL
jgi:prevent-host-death family protein